MSHIRLADVANIFVKLRKTQNGARSKAQCIESSSGEPKTHPGLEPVSERKVPLGEEERFVCRDGVDAVKLLRAVRTSLYEKAESIGANVLVDEQYVLCFTCCCAVFLRLYPRWTCAISGPRKENSYRVLVCPWLRLRDSAVPLTERCPF